MHVSVLPVNKLITSIMFGRSRPPAFHLELRPARAGLRLQDAGCWNTSGVFININ